MRLSVVIPVYNGAATIGPLVEAVKKELAPRYDIEIVLVNDGSPADNSAEVCDRLACEDPRVRFIDLSRNFGEHNAVMAGLNFVAGVLRGSFTTISKTRRRKSRGWSKNCVRAMMWFIHVTSARSTACGVIWGAVSTTSWPPQCWASHCLSTFLRSRP
ncbi:MAG: glycosyltransferase [Kiritimatiellae bacterium]|nr:glycosyltransferase [Kiritimatiellia bacterium]